MRYFLDFSYFGKSYHGWQRQPNAISVQQVLEEACSTLLRQPITLFAAGRTDAGVHARQMYAHLDVEAVVDKEDFIFRLNAFLPDDISIQNLVEVSDEAHARFDALERTYEYLIHQKKDPFGTETAHYLKHSLDIFAMNEAASMLLTHEDFECFSKTHTDVKTYRCAIKEAFWEKEDSVLRFTITADRFLRNMVRAVVGTLLEIGTGKEPVEHMKRVLESKNRSMAGASVPAKGLYLTRIVYPKNTFIVNG